MKVKRGITTFVFAALLSLHLSILNCCAQNIAADKNFEKKAYHLVASCYAGNSVAFQQFAKLLESEPNSIMYTFRDLLDEGIIHIITSDDNRLRYYYTWNPVYDGMNPSNQIIQYVNNGYSKVVCSIEEADFYPFIDSITTCTDKGIDYYIIQERMKLSYSSKQVWTSLSLVRIGETGLSVVDELSVGDSFYNLADWFFVQDPDNLCSEASCLIELNTVSNSISLPETLHGPEWDSLNLSLLSGKYCLYRITEGRFERVKTGLVNNLNPSLGDFSNLEISFKTKSFIIRVDYMHNGAYRYASWNSSQSTKDTPRLVLDNGIYDKQSDKYIFSNKGYYYLVGADRTGGNHYIEVLKGDKLILSETRRPGNE